MTAATTGFDTCALCPRLCRDACPVATGSAREASVPANLGRVLRDWTLGRVPADLARAASTLCVDCGGCHDACHLHRPLPELLREVRRELVRYPVPESVRAVEGEGDLVAVEADERPLAQVLARKLGRPVRRWPTGDHLGANAVESGSWSTHAARLREVVGGLAVVVVDGGLATALAAAGVEVRWAHVVVGESAQDRVGSCVCGGTQPMRCCGAASPLGWAHPEDARRVGKTYGARMDGERVVDARCRAHLRAAGIPASDPLDRWLTEGT